MNEPNSPDFDRQCMQRALQLALHGRGYVEPNPMVGCVIARGGAIVGEGWHGRFGGPHAEIEALRQAGEDARGATAYVTLEPCCHSGKTPPCTRALLHAGVRRMVVAAEDPFPQVAGRGTAELRRAGVTVEIGLLEREAERLTAPYRKLVQLGRPWVLAKWAMTLDGRIASRTGHSQWISNLSSRRVVHALRGRVDAIIVGSGTVLADDPQLTARPPGPRTALRVVLDGRLRTPLDCELVRTASDTPVLIATGPRADARRQRDLQEAGCELLVLDAPQPERRWSLLLEELGRRRMTNVLVEGGSQVLGSLRDLGDIDEVHVFVAPRLLGGQDAPASVAGLGAARIDDALPLEALQCESLDGDLHVWGVKGEARDGKGEG